MTYQVLARKWRPKSFATLVGQEHVIKALGNALDQQRLHHAYLLTGTRGVGKTTIARILAKSLNCETGITASPCGECSACQQIDAGRFVDLLEIDAASNTGIDNIREVLDNAQYAPTQGRFKVYIIDEVHMLSKSAFNAMLKTLEEPPGHVKFILATTDPQKVPVTVLSRCLQFSLRQMLPQQVSDHLKRVLDAEAVPYEPAALGLLGHAAAGSMRDALSLLDQAIAYGSGKVEEAGVRAMLGAVDQSYLYELLRQLAAQDGASLMASAQSLNTRGISADAALQELASLLHLLALARSVPAAIAADHPQAAQIGELAPSFTPEALQLYYQIALHGRRDLMLAPDEFAGLSMTLLRMLAFAPSMRMPNAMPLGNGGAPATIAPVGTAHPATPASAPIAPTPAVQAAAVAIAPAPASEPVRASPVLAQPEPATEPIRQPAVETPPWEEAPAAIQSIAEPAEPSPSFEPMGDEASEPARTFSGDWAELLAAMRLGGQANMLAQHAVLASHEGLDFHLAVPAEHRVVAGPDYRERLEQALSQYFGARARVHIAVGAEAHATPAAQAQRERQAGIAAAEAALNADPFVQAMIADFGAVIAPESIQPRTEPA